MPFSDRDLAPPPPANVAKPPHPAKEDVLEFLRREHRKSKPWYTCKEIVEKLDPPRPTSGKAILLDLTINTAIIGLQRAGVLPGKDPSTKPKQTSEERMAQHLRELTTDGFVEMKERPNDPVFKATRKTGKPKASPASTPATHP